MSEASLSSSVLDVLFVPCVVSDFVLVKVLQKKKNQWDGDICVYIHILRERKKKTAETEKERKRYLRNLLQRFLFVLRNWPMQLWKLANPKSAGNPGRLEIPAGTELAA